MEVCNHVVLLELHDYRPNTELSKKLYGHELCIQFICIHVLVVLLVTSLTRLVQLWNVLIVHGQPRQPDIQLASNMSISGNLEFSRKLFSNDLVLIVLVIKGWFFSNSDITGIASSFSQFM